MKKIITMLNIFILIFSFSIPTFAQAPFTTARDLYQMWAPGNFPDYVCGVWSTDSSMRNLTIAVQNTEEGNNGKLEILKLIEDDSTVTFTYQTYSRNYLTDVQSKLSALFKENFGLISTALDECENKIVLGILKEYNGNVATENMIDELVSQYGDIFTISYCDEPIEDTILTAPIGKPEPSESKPSHLTTILFIAILLLFCVSFMVIRKKHSVTIQTNTGETISASSPLSEKEVEKIVKNTSVDYPKDLDKKILDTIEKK